MLVFNRVNTFEIYNNVFIFVQNTIEKYLFYLKFQTIMKCAIHKYLLVSI